MAAIYTPEVGQIGSQLQSTFNLFDGAILNPDGTLVLEFERMLDTDETVAASFYFLTLAVITFLGEYTHPDEKIETFVHDVFEGMDGSITLACEDILSAVWAGYSATEIIWKADRQKLVLDYLATYHPYGVEFHVNERGRLKDIKQVNELQPLGVFIPAEKSVVFTYRKRFNNYYGKSAFKPLRKNWLLKDAFLKMWARALDKFGTPILAATVQDGTIKNPESNEEISQLDYAIRVLSNLQSGTALAFSTKDDTGKLPKIETLASGGTGVGEAFDKAISYLNKMLSRGLLVPSLVFDEGSRSGSLALGKSHFDGFILMAQSLFNQLKEVLLDQLISRLVTYNFGPQKNWGDFQSRQPGEEELKILSEMFLNLTNAGYMDATVEEDFKYARNKIGLPDRQPTTEVVAKDAYGHYLRANQEED
jgi:phage gp29-like protein